jgi:hypothetical protein
MKAEFIGDPSQPKGSEQLPDTIEVLGLVFEKGKATEIPAELEKKFSGHSHFRVTGADKV